ncbi:MAG: Hsp20/alpha crystallin family protein [Gammaproteobacteria bacterium]|nr:Hsp20/alpha crystallin family protein [Gammaproteobacteria bacterium]
MNTLDNMSQGMRQAWQHLTEGWQQLRDRAGHALTRFNPLPGKHSGHGSGDDLSYRGSRWGLLASDVDESGDSISVRLEAPGMEKDDFDLAVVNNHLLVRGEKHSQREQHKGHYHILECAYGSFERAIPLPAEVDENAARAKYKRGVLTVTLPKKKTAQRTRIEVQQD